MFEILKELDKKWCGEGAIVWAPCMILIIILFQFDKRNTTSRLDAVHDAVQIANIVDMVSALL